MTDENKEESIIGKIDYLWERGISETLTFTDRVLFEKTVIEDNNYGVPMSLTIYSNDEKDISFIENLDPIPDYQRIPPEESIEQIMLKLSKRIDTLAQENNPYEYRDNGKDSNENTQEIYELLESGHTKQVKEYLSEIGGEEDEYKSAQNLLKEIEDFEVKKYPDKLAFSIVDCYMEIHECEDGYDYSIYDGQYNLLDGGVYDDLDSTIYEALKEVVDDDVATPFVYRMDIHVLEYEDFIETVENKEFAKIQAIKNFEADVEENYNMIDGVINNVQPKEEKKKSILDNLKSKLPELNSGSKQKDKREKVKDER